MLNKGLSREYALNEVTNSDFAAKQGHWPNTPGKFSAQIDQFEPFAYGFFSALRQWLGWREGVQVMNFGKWQ